MLSPKTQYNLKNAKEYFEEHLCVGDYYSEGEHVSGHWIGKGAERLGLRGHVKRDDFLRLCENLHPQTGELLTQRRKTTRWTLDERGDESEVANRRVFYDFTISPPKDVSILALVSLIYAQLTHAIGLNDICDGLRGNQMADLPEHRDWTAARKSGFTLLCPVAGQSRRSKFFAVENFSCQFSSHLMNLCDFFTVTPKSSCLTHN